MDELQKKYLKELKDQVHKYENTKEWAKSAQIWDKIEIICKQVAWNEAILQAQREKARCLRLHEESLKKIKNEKEEQEKLDLLLRSTSLKPIQPMTAEPTAIISDIAKNDLFNDVSTQNTDETKNQNIPQENLKKGAIARDFAEKMAKTGRFNPYIVKPETAIIKMGDTIEFYFEFVNGSEISVTLDGLVSEYFYHFQHTTWDMDKLKAIVREKLTHEENSSGRKINDELILLDTGKKDPREYLEEWIKIELDKKELFIQKYIPPVEIKLPGHIVIQPKSKIILPVKMGSFPPIPQRMGVDFFIIGIYTLKYLPTPSDWIKTRVEIESIKIIPTQDSDRNPTIFHAREKNIIPTYLTDSFLESKQTKKVVTSLSSTVPIEIKEITPINSVKEIAPPIDAIDILLSEIPSPVLNDPTKSVPIEINPDIDQSLSQNSNASLPTLSSEQNERECMDTVQSICHLLVPEGWVRMNIIVESIIYGPQIITQNLLGKEVQIEEWVKFATIPDGKLEITDAIINVYAYNNKVKALEILKKKE